MSIHAPGSLEEKVITPLGEGAVTKEIPSHPDEVVRVQEEIQGLLQYAPLSDRDKFGINLAVEEALVNAIKHGNGLDPNKKVTIAYRLRPDAFDIHIADEGSGFDPAELPDPTSPEYLERPSGRGVMLMKHYMEVAFGPRGNSVHMRKVFQSAVTGGQQTVAQQVQDTLREGNGE